MDYRIENVLCRCGGEVWYDDMWRRGKATKDMRWEAFCRRCKACDPNGYSSRAKLLTESPAFWMPTAQARAAQAAGGVG